MCLMIVCSLVVSVRVLSQFHLQKQGVCHVRDFIDAAIFLKKKQEVVSSTGM